MRSTAEVWFRVQQECMNAWRAMVPPPLGATGSIEAPLALLPDPQEVALRLKETAFAAELQKLATDILEHRFHLLGVTVETGDHIHWRRDYVNGISSSAKYFRRVPYLEFDSVGDHKVIWELNRHQHLVLLAQASLLEDHREFVHEIESQIESWLLQNPFMRGINWASALEIAFRALSWLWVFHLVGNRMTREFRQRFLVELYRHGLYIEQNLSIYFSPNTHLLGEAVALHALGTLFPSFPRAQEWKRRGCQIVREQMDIQVRHDGSHFEQSSYYHVYALDMFLFHYVLNGGPPAFREKLRAMAEYLRALTGTAGRLPGIGDDDGGRFFHPYGSRELFGRSTLATCACLLDSPEWIRDTADLFEQAICWIQIPLAPPLRSTAPPVSQSSLFPQAGIASMHGGDVHILADAGPFGFGAAGHSHSDTLSLVVRRGAEDVLIDSGTFTYVTDLQWRNWFRSSAAHNTIRIDEADQATPVAPFRWTSPPAVEVLAWVTTPEHDFVDAACRYRGFSHRRRLFFLKPNYLFVVDEITGPPGRHRIEQFWHTGLPTDLLSSRLYRIGGHVRLILAPPFNADLSRGGQNGWRSLALGQKQEACVIRVDAEVPLPLQLAAALDFSGEDIPMRLSFETANSNVLLRLERQNPVLIRYPPTGVPSYVSGSDVSS